MATKLRKVLEEEKVWLKVHSLESAIPPDVIANVASVSGRSGLHKRQDVIFQQRMQNIRSWIIEYGIPVVDLGNAQLCSTFAQRDPRGWSMRKDVAANRFLGIGRKTIKDIGKQQSMRSGYLQFCCILSYLIVAPGSAVIWFVINTATLYSAKGAHITCTCESEGIKIAGIQHGIVLSNERTFRNLLQSGQHLREFLLSVGEFTSAAEVDAKQRHDGVNDLQRRPQQINFIKWRHSKWGVIRG